VFCQFIEHKKLRNKYCVKVRMSNFRHNVFCHCARAFYNTMISSENLSRAFLLVLTFFLTNLNILTFYNFFFIYLNSWLQLFSVYFFFNNLVSRSLLIWTKWGYSRGIYCFVMFPVSSYFVWHIKICTKD